MVYKLKEFKIDLSLEDFEESEDTYTFTAKSVTKDFVCEPGLERLTNDSPGKPVVWRHEHPVNPKYTKNHIYGRVLESHTEDGYFISKYQGYKHTKDHMKVLDIIKERDDINQPLSISIRYRQYGSDESPIHFDVIEHSLTPTPACKECVILDINNESENNMDEKELQEKLKHIAKLEEQLTLKTKTLEEMETKIVSLETTVEEAEKAVETKDKELETEKVSKEELVKKVITFNDKLNEQGKMIDKLNEGLKLKEMEPLVTKLIELDGKSMESLYRMKAQNSLKDESFEETKKFFEERIKEKETAITVAIPKELRETALESQIREEELEDEGIRTKRDRQAFANMPAEFFKKEVKK